MRQLSVLYDSYQFYATVIKKKIFNVTIGPPELIVLSPSSDLLLFSFQLFLNLTFAYCNFFESHVRKLENAQIFLFILKLA